MATLYTPVSFTEEFLSEVVSLVVMGSDKVWPILKLAFQITPVDGSSNRIHGCKSRKANAASISRVRAGQTAARNCCLSLRRVSRLRKARSVLITAGA